MVGRLVEEYLVVKTLGAGGFGKVFLVLQQPIMLKAALKLVHGHLSGGAMAERLLDKFHGEARALAQLTHPNIVRLLKFGLHQQSPYMVMEFVDGGRTLRDEMASRALSEQPMPIQHALRVLRQLIDGLGAAHKRGLLHRDVKPENIMLQRVEGNPLFVRILDFGLAKDLTVSNETSVAMGTPAYMAPEQIRRKDLGPWTDWYAVGIIAFELLTGRRPFGEAAGDTLFRIKLDPHYEPVSGLDASVPTPVVEFLHKATAHDSEERFRSAAEFRAGLDSAARALGETSGVTPLIGDERAPLVDVGGRTQPTPIPASSRSALGIGSGDAAGELQDTRQRLEQERARLQEERERLERRRISGVGTPDAIPATAPTLGADGLGLSSRSTSRWPKLAGLALLLAGGIAAAVLLTGDDPVAPEPRPITQRITSDRDVDGTRDVATTMESPVDANTGTTTNDVSTGEDVAVATVVDTVRPHYDPALPPPSRPDANANQGADGGIAPRTAPVTPEQADALLRVPAGDYPIGCQTNETRCWPDEKPGRAKKLSGFKLMTYEVTVGAYLRCVADGACRKPAVRRGCPSVLTPETAPMTCVSWEDAQAFCKRQDMRLPTESEWEAAARGAAHPNFPWGDERPTCAMAALKGCGVTLIGQRPKDRSWVGAFDMAGSVREWTASSHLPYPGSKTKHPKSRRKVPKVARGSSRAIRAKDAHTMRARLTQRPTDREPDLGFRCAKTL